MVHQLEDEILAYKRRDKITTNTWRDKILTDKWEDQALTFRLGGKTNVPTDGGGGQDPYTWVA
jgi:hypothetical protein